MEREPAPALIPKEIALRLCIEIRRENKGKWSFAAVRCWRCVRFSNGDPSRRRIGSRPGYCGCNLVNARYERLTGQEASRSRKETP